jgi:protein-S-isoprenylcysteine O-methyltransferase Ste14
MRSLELKIPPPVVLLVMAILMWLISRATPELAFLFPARHLVGIVVALLGLAVGTSGVVTFRLARTTVNPLRPDSASSLVSWGVFSVTRNPMYLGGLFMLTGWTIFLSNALNAVFLPAYVLYINLFQIAPEERALAALFGNGFDRYKSRTRRWL